MKTFLLLILTCLLPQLILQGQNIIPIPADSTAKWRINRCDKDGNCVNCCNSTYYVNGTVSFNGKMYYKIYESGIFFD